MVAPSRAERAPSRTAVVLLPQRAADRPAHGTVQRDQIHMAPRVNGPRRGGKVANKASRVSKQGARRSWRRCGGNALTRVRVSLAAAVEARTGTSKYRSHCKSEVAAFTPPMWLPRPAPLFGLAVIDEPRGGHRESKPRIAPFFTICVYRLPWWTLSHVKCSQLCVYSCRFTPRPPERPWSG